MNARNKVSIVVLLVATAWSGRPASANPVRITSGEWTISADPSTETFSVEAGKLGTLLQSGRLCVREGGELKAATGWNVRSGEGLIEIQTSNPRMGWKLAASGDVLHISSTDYGSVVTADAPSTVDRIFARLMDRDGAPVTWSGTGEVHGGYGGSYTRNPSFLPKKNADVMYVRLGRLEGAGFHSLFDRNSDTAIDFPEDAVLHRMETNQDLVQATIPVQGNALIRIQKNYYTSALGVPYYSKYDDRRFATAPIVWSSWTSYYEAVREQDITTNADWLGTHLKPYGSIYVELDDGYDRGPKGEHYWIENWDKSKFPHGAEWLTKYIHDRGMKAGVWLVPNSYAGAVKDHPERYVYDKKGDVLEDYSTPALDQTNPANAQFLKHEFDVLDGWGFDYYKFDGEHAIPKYVPTADLSKLHDPKADFLEGYRQRVKLIRDTIGPDRFIESCPAGTPLNSIGLVDSYFNGDDLYNNWQGMYPLFSSINSNLFLNHLLVYVMPGEGIELGEPMTVEEAKTKRPPIVVETEKSREDPMTGFGVTDAEARTLVSYVAMTGVVYPLASVMPELPESRVRLLKATMPTLPVMPVDLFSRGNDNNWDTFRHQRPDFYIHDYPEILDLKVNAIAGRYDLVGITNWRSATVTRKLDIAEKLSLDPKARYVAFDFWNQSLAGVFEKELKVEVAPHDTRVLAIHRVQSHPQLIGNSRHISGLFSVLSNSWDASNLALAGKAQTVGEDTYTAWIYCPKGFSVSQVQARSASGKETKVQYSSKGELIGLSFSGAGEIVDWSVKFARD
ncbi:MAG: alpha-galactosidase [Acidobacteria bacterium]|nr:alpha-galactosidase [Acidobacteriota bacterium]